MEPIKITLAVLIAGLLFNRFRSHITRKLLKLEERIGPQFFGFLLIIALGVLSSVITAIIAALLLVEIISALNLDRKFETRLTIIACFSIGLGAALTSIGEPLSTITVAKLRGAPYYADFLFFTKHLGVFILPGIIGLGILGAFFRGKEVTRNSLHQENREKLVHIFIRAGKVYLFIMALIFLGAGFKPMIDTYITKLPALALYWVNLVSAILDNATLAAAEISPKMTIDQLRAALLGFLLAGGMLIPGNIPNIIAANKLKIRSKEWAQFGVPLGLVMMIIYFLVLILF